MIDLTVAIPVYNTAPGHLIECIHSIRNQTHRKNFEVILVDDASDNLGTLRALKMLRTDCTIITLEKNEGTSGALNKAHEACSTEYMALCGSQDIWDRQKLELQLAFIKKNPDVDVISTQLFSFWDDDMYRKSLFTSNHQLIPDIKDHGYWMANHGTVIYKDASVKKVGMYDLNYRRGQDVNLWQRMYEAGMSFRCMQEVLYGWRKFKS